MASPEPLATDGQTADPQLNELRDLLGPSAGRVAELLPEAVALRTARDDKLGRALAPTVEKALLESVNNDPETIANAIFPIIGPAIRKSISEALKGMMQSLNQTLEQNLSVEGVRWRLEARRTGRPLSEVVLRHTLLYRVEHVLLVHRETGLLLSSVSNDPLVQQNADLISGMLTALRDFAHDSFGGGDDTSLDTIELGDLTIHVEQGPHALLAAVVRGTPPREALAVLPEVIEEIHATYGPELRAFDGDDEAFATATRPLGRCISSQERPSRRGVSPALILLAAVVIVAIVGAGVFSLWSARRLGRLVDALEAEPGIVVTHAERSLLRLDVRGLRYSLSREPQEVARDVGIAPEHLTYAWERFHALSPELVLRRAIAELAPPQGVELQYDAGRLSARGSGPASWHRSVRQRATSIAGVDTLDLSQLQTREAELARAGATALAERRVPFASGSSAPEDLAEVELARSQLLKLDAALAALGCVARVVAYGHTDAQGSAADNEVLSLRRAEAVAQMLKAQPLPRVTVDARPGGPLETATGSADTTGRVVYFEVLFDGECGLNGNE